MTTHAQNLRVFDVWSGVVGLREGDRYLIVNPFFHGFGYKAGWLACLLRGATNLPHPVFDVSQVLERVARDRVTVLPGPPTLYQMILAHPDRARFDLSSLRLAVTGAAVIPVELIHRMRRELALETIITAYGLTESTGVVTISVSASIRWNLSLPSAKLGLDAARWLSTQSAVCFIAATAASVAVFSACWSSGVPTPFHAAMPSPG